MKVYEKVYNFYADQIRGGQLDSGDRLPSLRESAGLLSVSRTSVETAYLQLEDDGYIYSMERMGYFVSKTADRAINAARDLGVQETPLERKYKYDLATIGEDKSASCLELWRRYMKSALRQEDRLGTYADGQGEYDLRQEIADYVRKTRNIICSAESIVVGAGFQTLLPLLINLIGRDRSISFPTREFADVAAIFENAGFDVSFRNKEAHVIYVTPSYMTKWGDVMPMKRRQEIIEHALKLNHLIIEDDYQNDFVFGSRPTPSLYAMSGGEGVAFLGSFSRILLPSVRISYLILPRELMEPYGKIRHLYNQSASKTEQIALTQFLRDGHLKRHIKSLYRLYAQKREMMLASLNKYFGGGAELLCGDSGMEIGMKIKKDISINTEEVKTNIISESEDEYTILLSCSAIEKDCIDDAICLLKGK